MIRTGQLIVARAHHGAHDARFALDEGVHDCVGHHFRDAEGDGADDVAVGAVSSGEPA